MRTTPTFWDVSIAIFGGFSYGFGLAHAQSKLFLEHFTCLQLMHFSLHWHLRRD